MSSASPEPTKGQEGWEVPTFRGVTHRYALFACLGLAPVAYWVASTADAKLAALIFGAAHVLLFAASAAYHGFYWTECQRVWMRRLDHTMIYVLIAGGYTPFGLVLVQTEISIFVLWALWILTAIMVPVNLLWARRPKALNATLAVAAGSLAILVLPDMAAAEHWEAIALLLFGGVFHIIGAAVYGMKKPILKPGVFEYHELFHALMLVGIASHYAAVLVYVLPAS
jgi:hemolysin III